MSFEHPKSEEPKEPETNSEQSALTVADLEKRMATLEERIKQTQSQKAKELEQIWREGSNFEYKREDLATRIEYTKKELQQFEQLMQSARELGLDVEQDQKFMEAFKAEKDGLAALEQRQAELKSRTIDIASNPEVLGKVHEQALVEYKQEELLKEIELDLIDELPRQLPVGDIKEILSNDPQKTEPELYREMASFVWRTLWSSKSLGDFREKIRRRHEFFAAVWPIGTQEAILRVVSQDKKVREYFERKTAKGLS